MRGTRILLAAAIVLLSASCAGGRDFGRLCRAVDSQPGVQRQRVPFFGLARVGVKMIKPAGVHDIRLALYEHSTGFDGAAASIDSAIESATRDGWSPFLKVREADGSRTTMWIRPQERVMEMLLLVHEPEESVVMQLRMDPEILFAKIAENPGGFAREARGTSH